MIIGYIYPIAQERTIQFTSTAVHLRYFDNECLLYGLLQCKPIDKHALSQSSFCFISFTGYFSFVFLDILGRRVYCSLVSGTLAFDLPTSINSP